MRLTVAISDADLIDDLVNEPTVTKCLQRLPPRSLFDARDPHHGYPADVLMPSKRCFVGSRPQPTG
jgi:hypothetical protein